jgi:hypothetical protein
LKARVFLDAFAECVAGVGMARRLPILLPHYRTVAVVHVTDKHGATHAEATGRMFDRLWADMRNPGAHK